MSATIQPKGKVIFVGAGPGDPELITLKAIRFLENADVVIADRLVSDEIIRLHVNPFAEMIYAGKQSGKGYSTRQSVINQMLVAHAAQGKQVVRLKGGDVSVFSNILDELSALKAASIPFEIIPGITAALGAAASAGIPLTARDHSTAVRFLTYYKSDILSEDYWKELANTSDTLVFYMSSETLHKAVNKLISYNVDDSKSIAVIEQATTIYQKVSVYEFSEFAAVQPSGFMSPTLVIIGKTVALHKQFNWVENYHGNEYYFQPLTKATAIIAKSGRVYS